MHKFATYLFVMMVLGLSACGPNIQNIGKESDPTRFYTLANTAKPLDKHAALPWLTLGVGPVVVADYLDRTQMVTRTSLTKLDISDFDRWAAEPHKEIQRVMAADFAVLIGTEKIANYPWKTDISVDYSVELQVERFEYAEDGKVHLEANWQVFDTEGKVVVFRHTALELQSNKDFGAISEGLSSLMGQLDTLIAEAIYQHTQPIRK